MKHTYLFTWKVIGLGLTLLLSTGVCLASFSQTSPENDSNSNITRNAANTIPTRTPSPDPTDIPPTDTPPTDTPPTNTPPTEVPPTDVPPTGSSTATPVPEINAESNLIAYLPLVSRQEAQSGSGLCGGLLQEAEQGTLFGKMEIGTDNQASGQRYIHAPGESGESIGGSGLSNSHRADYCVTITQAGSYIVRGWVSSADIKSDSFYVTMDGLPSNGHLWETAVGNGFQEDYVNDRGKTDLQVFNLAAGEHTFSVYYREANTKLDRFEFINSTQAPSATATPVSGGGGGSGGGNPVPTATPISGGGGGGGGGSNPGATPSAGNVDGWPMAGANLERTSSVADGPNPREHSNYGIKWYRPIEAYIGQHVQLIAARNKIYAATAKGLYALHMETGDTAWQFDTDMPLGHSPTVDGDRIFVGGFDKRIYALNADTGALIWKFEGAKGGFSTNPIVVGGQVLMGSRDGYFYSVNRENGQLNWQYPPANQAPLGPILYSAAYKDGNVYFASNDNHGYALNASNGALVWKSNKMPGDGYQAFWPVIYNNFVIFSSAPAYVEGADPGATSVGENEYGNDFIKTTQRDDIYPNGTENVSGADFAQYLEEKPWRRGVIVLNTSNGQEFTFDSDNDGKPEYAPFLFAGTKSGNRYPPLVINNELYAQNMSSVQTGWGISRAQLAKWEFGTTSLEFGGFSHAIDEPFADSAAGTMVYTNLCCDRVAGYKDLESGTSGNFWDYSHTLETVDIEDPEAWRQSLAPNYDVMWWESSMYGGLPRLTGAYGSPNGIYHNHSIQNPIIPYNNMLFVHRSNAIIAMGPNSTDISQRGPSESVDAYEARIRNQQGEISKPLLTANNQAPAQSSVLSEQDVRSLLDREISKMLQAGHLRPGYYNGTRSYQEFFNSFENPGETLLTLVEAYPHVSPSLQPQLKQYIDEHYEMYFGSSMIARTGYQNLAPREWMPIPPEAAQSMSTIGPSGSARGGTGWSFPQFNIYAMWKYADLFYANDQAKLDQIYASAKSKLDTTPASADELKPRIWLDNGYIAGYTGFLGLQELAGKSGVDSALRSEVNGLNNSLLQKRAAEFSKDQPYITVDRGSDYYKRSFNVARNFIYLTPELADYLRANAFNKVSAAVAEYDQVAPYWIATRYEASIQEFSSDNLYTHSSMFKAKALIMDESPAELRKYIDSPAFAVGDLIYIQNLSMALDQ
ncbi:MAG: PQQ-binding-like beta-propeller repeat protein [Anaerolineae bacterium]